MGYTPVLIYCENDYNTSGVDKWTSKRSEMKKLDFDNRKTLTLLAELLEHLEPSFVFYLVAFRFLVAFSYFSVIFIHFSRWSKYERQKVFKLY